MPAPVAEKVTRYGATDGSSDPIALPAAAGVIPSGTRATNFGTSGVAGDAAGACVALESGAVAEPGAVAESGASDAACGAGTTVVAGEVGAVWVSAVVGCADGVAVGVTVGVDR